MKNFQCKLSLTKTLNSNSKSPFLKKNTSPFNHLQSYAFILLFFLTFTKLFAAEYQKIYLDKNSIIFGDGDTISYVVNDSTTVVRFLGVDTPEVSHGEDGIFSHDQYLGQEASEFTKKEILKAQEIFYIALKEDRYGRTLGYIYVDGELLAVKIIRAGLGYQTVSFYKNKGVEDIDAIVLAASEEIDKPNFQNPFYWRKKNRNPNFT